LDLERQYRPTQDYGDLSFFAEGGFWQKQKHIYDSPLYYIDYCIAQADALQYRAWMHRDRKAAWDSYLKLCKLSASDYFTGLLKKVGLDNPFEEGCLRHIVRQLEEKS
ncbi:MAG: M3 family oligoendopeptidase, partial [Butyrivibrio sp.]|nr:M3 family oligoendopeptidase [Butyrivibrio sp.]